MLEANVIVTDKGSFTGGTDNEYLRHTSSISGRVKKHF